jgi:hypothetical protein
MNGPHRCMPRDAFERMISDRALLFDLASAIGYSSHSVLDPIAAYFDIPTDFRKQTASEYATL